MYNILLLIKIAILLITAMYLSFAFVIFTQIRTMHGVLSYPKEKYIEMIGIIHLILSISLFIIALVIL
ncbi:hypothetical protein LBMAG33_5330 [Candidatus Levyibacteriota bacterium]|nr:hypothetical protein [Candidatus Levybacteria bacterium]GDX62223.1 hypothetical protein LBMAG33_5330 [Candidatus Levybacteria bacterium]